CRLAGPILQRTTQRELLSVAVSPGTVQVPPDGQPIVLLADAQTTGGYPRIAQVISVDLPRFAQRAPQDIVHMEWVDIATAQVLSLAQQQAFDLLTHAPS
ncbi:MAG TPA: carboxylase, partial [Candidatus Paenalcaligenes intestinipullorum]|nr:carboxylase [Candidatus Paenalcaligenes intestinipullorum]